MIGVLISPESKNPLPQAGIVEFEDAESGQRVMLDTNSKRTRTKVNRLERERVRALHKSFRQLLKSKGSKYDALEELKPLCDQYPEVEDFVNFVINSKRGIAS